MDKPLTPLRWSCWWTGALGAFPRTFGTELWGHCCVSERLWRHGVLGIPAWRRDRQHRAEDAGAFTKQMGLVLKLPGKESRTKTSFPWQSWTTCPNMLGLSDCFGYWMIWGRREEAFVSAYIKWVMDWLLTISISAATCHISLQYLYIDISRFFGFPFCPSFFLTYLGFLNLLQQQALLGSVF